MFAYVTFRYHHYVALAGFGVDCERLHARWRAMYADAGEPGGAHPQPACVVATLPLHGLSDHVELHGFWAGRYAFLTSMVERRVNTMLTDLDFAFHHDIYADLAEPCLAGATLVLQPEGGGPNAGFVYARGAHPDGAAHWVLAQVKRRVDMFYAERDATGTEPGRTWEQDILKDATRVASSPNGSHWDMGPYRDTAHPFWKMHPQEGYSQEYVTTTVELDESLGCAAASRFNAAGTGKFSESYGVLARQKNMQLLYKPSDAPGEHDGLPLEYALYAPAYFLQFGNVVSPGFNVNNMPSSLTHMLKSEGIWLPTVEDVQGVMSHVSRLANMQAHGRWAPEINEDVAANRSLLFIKESLVAAASEQPDVGALRELISRALHAAALTDRVLVLPQLPCDSPWLQRGEDNNGHAGVQDLRVIVVPQPVKADAPQPGEVLCYTGVHSYEFCWPWDHVAYAFDPVVIRRRAAARTTRWSRAELQATRDDVVINHLPFHAVADAMTPQDAAMMEHLENDCKDVFAKAKPPANATTLSANS